MLGGCEQAATTRSLFELTAWATDYYQQDDYRYLLEASYKNALEVLNEQGANTMAEREYRRVLLPDKNNNFGSKAWNSGGQDSQALPTELRQLTNNLERRWVNTLIELREKLALDLEPIPTLERGMGLQSKPLRKVDFMVIGSSNAGRLTTAQNDAHYSVNSILNSTWRVTRESCEAMAETVKKQIRARGPRRHRAVHARRQHLLR
jgi:hypothetical protein